MKADEMCKAKQHQQPEMGTGRGSLTPLAAVLPPPLLPAIIPADLQIPDSYF